MLFKVAEKPFRDYFYNFRTLANKMRIVLAILKLTKSEWVRKKEIEEVAKMEDKLGLKLNPIPSDKDPEDIKKSPTTAE